MFPNVGLSYSEALNLINSGIPDIVNVLEKTVNAKVRSLRSQPHLAHPYAQPKSNAVKQELDKLDELKRSAVRAVASLTVLPDAGVGVQQCNRVDNYQRFQANGRNSRLW